MLYADWHNPFSLSFKDDPLLKFDPYGIYCPEADVYIDPWKPVDRAIITHAHSDHARWGSKHYLAHNLSVPILKLRLGDVSVEGVEYGETFFINGVKFSFHPAGHIPGSSQIRMEHKGEVWVASGDYKLQSDGISAPFEPVKCHHFVTESTFGLPVYRFPKPEKVHADINSWWKKNKEEGKASLLIGYTLGKAQRILHHLDAELGNIFVHGAVGNINDVMVKNGIQLPPYKRTWEALSKEEYAGSVIVAPPSSLGSTWLRRFDPFSIGICSGWMQLRGTRRRKGADRGFVLSDHADWDDLNVAIKQTGAENVYVTHGYKPLFAKWLREEHKLNAVEVDTLYEGEVLNEGSTEGEKEAENEEVR